MEPLRISLFGVFEAEYEGEKLDAFRSCKEQQLFSYLVLYAGRRHPREKLACILAEPWEASPSRAYLRKVLWQLQQDLAILGGAEPSPLRVEREWIQFVLDERIWVDVVAFEQAYAAVKGKPGYVLNTEHVRQLEAAVRLYKGDLLETCYKHWCVHEQQRLNHLYLVMLDKLMSACEVQHQYEQGISYGQRILSCDEAREQTHRKLMRLYYLAGERTAALRQYERCIAQLKEQLDVLPAEPTTVLYQYICADNKAAIRSEPFAADGAFSIPADHALKIMLPSGNFGNLDELRAGLLSLQRHTQEVLQFVELKLESFT